ncbi:MAG: ATP-binding protein [Acidobacteriota bacterium]
MSSHSASIDSISRELSKKALEHTSCGVTLCDIREPSMPLIYVNEAFEAMTGFARDQVLGKNCRFLQQRDRDQQGLVELRSALENRRHCRVKLRNYRQDGSLFWNELTLSPLSSNGGEITHYVGIQTDVTGREESKRQTALLLEELSESNQDLHDFAHVVSHDLRAPLRGIGNLSRLLLDGHCQDLGEEGRDLVHLLDSRVRHLDALLRGVLRYSASRSQPVEVSEVDTRQLVRDVLETLDPPPGLQVEISQDLPTILGDSTRLTQIFQNLLDNAIKYQENGDGWISVRAASTRDSWHFSVADGGPGVAAEDRQRIFQIFQTARQSREVSGVGLAIVRKAVEKLGGSVWIESELGRGTEVHFSLPKTLPESRGPKA